ncbi:AMP-binding protein [Pseudonocardia alni]|uniref:AMP-binding protein n=1 Tax=Pseudonocardia alni TaxID=33907 RepID=UPI0033D0578E
MPTTLRSLFTSALDRLRDEPAVTTSSGTYPYRRLVADSNRLAHFLTEHGVGPGVAVALMLSNGAEYVVADQAVLRCGAIKVPLNDMIGTDEARYILADSGARIAFATAAQLPVALAALADDATALHTVVSVDGAEPGTTTWADALGDRPTGLPEIHVDPDTPGLILYTGGTTGRPKGVVHSQSRLVLNLLSQLTETGLGDDERMLLTSPLPHAAGFLLQAGMLKGAHAHLTRSFEAGEVLDRIERDRITFLFAVPTMIYRLLDRAAGQDAGARDLSSLRTLLYGAAPITPERLVQGLDLLGPVFMQLYGQSEAPNFITRLRREDHDPARPGRLLSCGRPVAMAEVRIVGDDGTPCGVGEVGEVAARTPYTMLGYHGLPEKSAETVRDGWLFTGDVGRLDEDGYLYLVDRKNDMIITGGMNVYSSEVENAVAGVDGVAAVAVVGVPHPDWGEAVVAFVVGDGVTEVSPAAVIARCREVLSRYKVPKEVRVVPELPVTAVGKLDKKALRSAW